MIPAQNKKIQVDSDTLRALIDSVESERTTLRDVAAGITEYRKALGPSVIAVGECMKEAAIDQLEAAKTSERIQNSFMEFIKDNQQEQQAERREHRQEIKDIGKEIKENTAVVSQVLTQLALSNERQQEHSKRQDIQAEGLLKLCDDFKATKSDISDIKSKILFAKWIIPLFIALFSLAIGYVSLVQKSGDTISTKQRAAGGDK